MALLAENNESDWAQVHCINSTQPFKRVVNGAICMPDNSQPRPPDRVKNRVDIRLAHRPRNINSPTTIQSRKIQINHSGNSIKVSMPLTMQHCQRVQLGKQELNERHQRETHYRASS